MSKNRYDIYPHNADELRTLVDQYNGIQRQRIAALNRAKAIERGDDLGDSDMYRGLAERMQSIENDIAKLFKEELAIHPMGGWLLAVRGIGATMAAKVVGHIGDIARFETAAKLWRYAGYGLVPKCAACDAWIEEITGSNGDSGFRQECQACGSIEFKMVAERPVKGHKLHYDPKFKTAMHNLADGLLRANSPYRRIYDEAYEYYMKNRPGWALCQDCDSPITECKDHAKHGKKSYRSQPGKGWSTNRIHLASRRKMIKVFLSHVFEAWRRIEGLPIRPLYVHAVLGHEDRLMPEQFVEFALPKAKWAKG